MIDRLMLAAGLFATCSGYALADSAPSGPQAYFGIGGAVLDLDAENGVGSNDDIQSTAFAGLVGVELNDVIAFEAEVALSSGEDDSISRNGAELGVGLNTQLGAYAKASLPISNVFSIYGRLGYANVDYTVRDPSVGEGFEATMDLSDNGVALGGGMQFSFGRDRKNSIRVDFTQINADDLPTQRYGVSYVRRF